jgi:DNA invertase Pin-like site-specific DNA recombinase
VTAKTKPQTSALPEIFNALEPLFAEPHTIDRAKRLGEALNAIPELQKALRAARSEDVNHLKDSGQMAYDEQAAALNLTYASVARIANGGRSGKEYAKVKEQSGG